MSHQSWGMVLTDTGHRRQRSGQNPHLPVTPGHGSLLSDLTFCMCRAGTGIPALWDVQVRRRKGTNGALYVLSVLLLHKG